MAVLPPGRRGVPARSGHAANFGKASFSLHRNVPTHSPYAASCSKSIFGLASGGGFCGFGFFGAASANIHRVSPSTRVSFKSCDLAATTMAGGVAVDVAISVEKKF